MEEQRGDVSVGQRPSLYRFTLKFWRRIIGDGLMMLQHAGKFPLSMVKGETLMRRLIENEL
jgi:hypothetical protein